MLYDAINYPDNSKTAFTIWIISSLVLCLIFCLAHWFWTKRQANQKYLKLKQEEGIISFLKRNVFLLFAAIFFISLITAIWKFIVLIS